MQRWNKRGIQMNLSLLITARCNASCAHCSTSCGPHRTESLAREEIFGLMDQAAALSDDQPPEFYLSGGEPFLDFALLLEIVSYGRRLGAPVTCVTNGYWATSEQKAHEILTAVCAAGLTELAISRSRFHEAFVSRTRLERVLAASRAIGLPCTVKRIRLRSERESRNAATRWAKAAGAARTQEFALMPHLRTGVRVADDEYIRRKGLPRGRCPSPLLTIKEDGGAYTCCTPGGFNQFLALGSARTMKLGELRDRFYLGGAQQILRKRGPIHFARAIQAEGLGDRLRPSYAGVCDLCTHMTSDPALAAAATRAANAFETRQLESILAPAVRQEPGNIVKENRHAHHHG